MFGIGSSELLVILVVALIVLGPKSLANVSRTLGKAMGEFRRVSTDFQRTLNAEAEEEEQRKRKQEAARAAKEAAVAAREAQAAEMAAAASAAPTATAATAAATATATENIPASEAVIDASATRAEAPTAPAGPAQSIVETAVAAAGSTGAARLSFSLRCDVSPAFSGVDGVTATSGLKGLSVLMPCRHFQRQRRSGQHQQEQMAALLQRHQPEPWFWQGPRPAGCPQGA